ncbi:Site-specific recombinase XerD [Hymenobacter actinosclerus]|uniref:Site-specific recombinase XerD n=2 Tax=Hymenobacter actinosclerus TaxID=82805 RepID=A0A1I0JDF3_9BACT|nr:Site-specific recombinase XerD [Hymenobacter actinosclerus]
MVYVHWMFSGLMIRHSTGLSVDSKFIGANGFVKTSYSDHLDTNNQLQATFDRYKLAGEIVIASGDVTEEKVKKEYKRLVDEEQVRKEKAEGDLVLLDILKYTRANRKSNPESETIWFGGREDGLDTIEGLEAKLLQMKQDRDNQLRKEDKYDDDLLSTFLIKYKSRKGSATMEESSKRVVDSFIKTLDRFNANWKIQDVNEQTLIAFQDWLIAEGKVNSTTENYTTKIKSCLNYYADRPALLPSHVILTKDYKNYSCDLTQKPEHVIALSPAEIHDLLLFSNYKKRSWEKIRDVFVLLCATGCRISDAMKINPTFIKNGDIHFTPKKTKKKVIQVTIPLNPLSTYILQKYDWDMTKVKLEDYYLNEQIKLIAELIGGSFNIVETVNNHCGIQPIVERKKRHELLTTHCGRRTYSTLRAAQGANVGQLMGETGHTDPKTLMLYVNKKTQRIEQPFTLPLLLN